MATNWPYSTRAWKRYRRAKLALAGWKCERCGLGEDDREKRGRLHVHHKTPLTEDQRRTQDESAGFPDLENVEALCLNCHSKEHGLRIRCNDDEELTDEARAEEKDWQDFIDEGVDDAVVR